MTNKAYHGGAFFEAIGEDFSKLNKAQQIINADVLDAWFDPCPGMLSKLRTYTEFIIKTSPPTHSNGLIDAIAKARRIQSQNILVNGGSSDVMFSIFPRLINKKSKVLILDPMYGEYSHIFQYLTESNLFRHHLKKENDFVIDIDLLKYDINRIHPNLVVIVNPNSPTGKYCKKNTILQLIKSYPLIQFVVDETYIEYVDKMLSLESDACKLKNLIIIKSMSKVYALSGARVGYLVSDKKTIDRLSPFIPPWSVSLPGQVCAVEALKDEKYYQSKYDLTHMLRNEMLDLIRSIPTIKLYDSVANFYLIELKDKKLKADKIVESLRAKNIFIRNCDSMSKQFKNNFIRIAVKDHETNMKIWKELKKVLN